MKIHYLLVLLVFSAKIYSQTERARGMEVRSAPVVTLPANTESKGTIVFKGPGTDKPVQFLSANQSFIGYIYSFSSAAEAESFATAFKNSDPNISACQYNNREAGGYYEFSFSVKEARDAKWYLGLFKQNNLSYIKFNDGPKSIDKLLEK